MSHDKRLVTWKNWVAVFSILFLWTAYRIYSDYQLAGAFELVPLISTLAALAIGVVIVVVVFRYANRPETEKKR